MKFSVNKNSLLEALQKVHSVVEKKNTVPILANILCVAEKDKLSLAATDLEVGIKVSLPVETQQEGKITLSAKHFIEIVKELPDKPLFITKKNNDWVEIVCQKSRFNIVSLPAQEYPTLPSFEQKKNINCRAEALTDMINKTSFAVSSDATRYHLNGVYFEPLKNNIMRMIATDGHRLSFIDQEIFEEVPELKRGLIIPKKGLGELKKLLDQSEGHLKISFDRGYFFANINENYLFIRLIEGEYPDYRQVIPKETKNEIVLDRDGLISALRRVSLLSHEKSRGVKLKIQNGEMSIHSSNPDMGEACEEIDIEYSGEPIEIGFNAKYLLDCLPVIESDKLRIKIKDRLSPGILQGYDQKNHTYVIMPMRI